MMTYYIRKIVKKLQDFLETFNEISILKDKTLDFASNTLGLKNSEEYDLFVAHLSLIMARKFSKILLKIFRIFSKIQSDHR